MAKKREYVDDIDQEVIDFVSSKAKVGVGIGSALGIEQSLRNGEKPKPSDVVGLVPNPVASALSLTLLAGEKEHKNIKQFQKNKNRGKKLEPKKPEQNTRQVESTKTAALNNSKKFTK
jgi:hypothetical protein